LRSQIGSNVTLHHVPVNGATEPITAIKSAIDAKPVGTFDVIVVDGHLRRKLIDLAFSYLGPSGALLLDNSEGFGFFDETKSRSCRRIDFFGFAPGVSLRHCTSLVFVDDCFLLQPDIPISDIEMIES
jgi:hypothetical protein